MMNTQEKKTTTLTYSIDALPTPIATTDLLLHAILVELRAIRKLLTEQSRKTK